MWDKFHWDDRKSRRLWQAVLILVFAWIAAASLHRWPAEIFNYDLLHDLNNARELLAGGGLPVHGSVASYGVFNPPGPSYGLVLGYLFSPNEPMLAMRIVTITLSGLTVLGLYLLLGKRFGTILAIWACLLYLVSSTGWYFMAEMRPRAHPVFIVWSLYLMDLLINERKGWAIGVLIFVQAAALYWMLEIAPFVLFLVILVVWYRPETHWRWFGIGVVLSFLLWVPYLNFQWDRGFKDLRYLVVERKPAHKIAQYFKAQLEEAGLERKKGYRPHTIPDYRVAAGGDGALEASNSGFSLDRSNETGEWKAMLPEIRGNWLSLLFLLVVPVAAGLRVMGSGPKTCATGADRLRNMVWAMALGCGLVMWVLTRGEGAVVLERRFLWIWVLWALSVVLAVDYIIQNSVARWSDWASFCRSAILGLFVVALALHETALAKSESLIGSGGGLAEAGEFREVIDAVARLVKEEGLEARIGYDLPFLAWIPAVHKIDGESRIGIQYDAMLEYRYGIKNLNKNPLSVSKEDVIRVVEHHSEQPWRQSYLDLSGYPLMKVELEIGDYTILTSFEKRDQIKALNK